MHISKYMDGTTITVFDDKDFIANLAQCQLIYSEDKKEVSDVLAKLTAVKDTETVEIRVDFIGNGVYLWHRAMLVSVVDTNGVVKKIVGKLYSIHEEKLQSQELILRAERDSLTGVYNHSTFVSKVSRFLAEFDETLCALYMIDLDDFKLVNDALGHYAGMICCVTQQLFWKVL